MSKVRDALKRAPLVRGGLFAAQNVAYTARTGLRAKFDSRPRASTRYFLAGMVRVKDEARFLPEWIAHHLGVGFEHFYVYDNGSTDGTKEVLDPFIRSGAATYIPWPTRPISPSSHIHFLDVLGMQSKWVAFLDADEFIREEHRGQTLQWLHNNPRRPALAINWRYYGSSWFETVPAGLVTENFIWADASLNDHIKVIAQPSQILGYRNPHNFYYRQARFAVTLGGTRAFGSFANPTSSGLWLSHFVYRSRADYERKASRGFAERRGERDNRRNHARIDLEYSRHNEERHPMPSGILQRTREILASHGFPREFYAGHSRPEV